MSESKIEVPGTIGMTAIVFYHANCTDGFGAAWVFDSVAVPFYGLPANYIPCGYNKPIPEVPQFQNPKEVDVYILDFSFDRATILNLADTYRSVTVLDHHKTAKEILGEWEHGRDNIKAVFDMTRSGAGITWDYFAPEYQGRSELVKYIEDRDLWKFALPDSKEINALIGFTKKEFFAYDNLHRLLSDRTDKAIAMGTLLLEQQDRHVDSIIKSTRTTININGYVGLCCNCNGQFASDVGNKLAEECGMYGATWFQDKNGAVKFSLRSIGDYDVEKIARAFGGGGHKNAAGFTFMEPLANVAGSGVSVWNINSDEITGQSL